MTVLLWKRKSVLKFSAIPRVRLFVVNLIRSCNFVICTNIFFFSFWCLSQNVLFIYISHQLTISSQNGASQYIFLIYPPFSNCSRQSESLIWAFKLDTEHTLGTKIIKIYVRLISVSTGVSLDYLDTSYNFQSILRPNILKLIFVLFGDYMSNFVL